MPMASFFFPLAPPLARFSFRFPFHRFLLSFIAFPRGLMGSVPSFLLFFSTNGSFFYKSLMLFSFAPLLVKTVPRFVAPFASQDSAKVPSLRTSMCQVRSLLHRVIDGSPLRDPQHVPFPFFLSSPFHMVLCSALVTPYFFDLVASFGFFLQLRPFPLCHQI